MTPPRANSPHGGSSLTSLENPPRMNPYNFFPGEFYTKESSSLFNEKQWLTVNASFRLEP